MADDEERTASWLRKHDVSEGGWRRNAAQKAEEQRVCYELRLKGHTLWQITELAAKELGWSLSTATVHRRVEDEALARVEPVRDALRQMQVDRLDRYLQALENTAADPAAKPADRIAAVNTALKVHERRSKLQGLDEPDQHVVAHIGPEDVELAAMIREEQAKQARDEAELLRLKRKAIREEEKREAQDAG